MFCDSCFFLKYFFTLLTLLCLNCLFHMNNHIDLAVCVMFVEIVSGLNIKSKNIQEKKHQIFFGVRLEFSTFQTYFTKYKTFTDGQFFQ